MLRQAAALLVLALLTAAAAPAAKAPTPKAAAAKAAPPAKAPAPKPAAAFEPGDPSSLVGLLNAAGARAQLGQRAQDTVQVAATSPAANFSVLFVGCSAQGRDCQAAVYDSPLPGSANLQQINGFNQSSAMCRGYQDRAGRPHVVYSVLTFASTTREQTLAQLGGWQGCLADFARFLKDPTSYLAEAP
ncbi:hypothetical protein [Phenylobacterium sp.]|jgi:hypothetical protein|uniref:hypothetical protein n=1 Tax=Phenylobacterium sp. TaxID=1871053 RepID=UPI002F94FBE4